MLRSDNIYIKFKKYWKDLKYEFIDELLTSNGFLFIRYQTKTIINLLCSTQITF